MNQKEKQQLTHADLRQFTGDSVRYQTINRGVVYSPGVQYLAEHGRAYWLVDAMASYYGTATMLQAIQEDHRLATLQFWRLDVRGDQTATLTAKADSDVPPFIRQEIPFTDFPFAHVDIWAGLDARYWVLYLPSEH